MPSGRALINLYTMLRSTLEAERLFEPPQIKLCNRSPEVASYACSSSIDDTRMYIVVSGIFCMHLG